MGACRPTCAPRRRTLAAARGGPPGHASPKPCGTSRLPLSMSKMAASETVRLRLQFDYPPPATPHCTVFWLLVDLNRCRVVTDLISLIRQRFGFSSGALLGLYLEGGLLPPAESARLVRDNDCLRCAGARGVGWGVGARVGLGGRACWIARLGTPSGELAAERHVREILSGPAGDGASFPGALLIPGGLDSEQLRCTRAGPVLIQPGSVCCVHGADMPQTRLLWVHLVSGVGDQSKQEDRNVFLVMYAMSHLSALAMSTSGGCHSVSHSGVIGSLRIGIWNAFQFVPQRLLAYLKALDLIPSTEEVKTDRRIRSSKYP